MSSLTRLNDRLKNLPRHQTGVVILTMWVLLAGCRAESVNPAASSAQNAATPDLDAEIVRASNLQQPIFVLVTESGLSRRETEPQG
jgi:hypothetical protein